MRRFSFGRGFAEGNTLLLIHRSAVPLLRQEKARAKSESRYEGERTAGEGALRVVGGADPYRGEGEKYAFSGGRRWQPKADG